MNRLRHALFVFCLIGRCLAQSVPAHPDVTPALLQDISRYLYRWHLDETSLLPLENVEEIAFKTRLLHPELDENDQSHFLELFIPSIRFRLVLKKADYCVPELDITVRNAGFRVYLVERIDDTGHPLPEELHRVSLNKRELLQHLHDTRGQCEFPHENLMERLRTALREEYADLEGIEVEGPQTVYVAPLSPVSNTLWVYWENQRRLIRFSSDGDLHDEENWHGMTFRARMFDLRDGVVLSLSEAAGSGAYLTRDQASRILFNCVVLGRRISMEPRD